MVLLHPRPRFYLASGWLVLPELELFEPARPYPDDRLAVVEGDDHWHRKVLEPDHTRPQRGPEGEDPACCPGLELLPAFGTDVRNDVPILAGVVPYPWGPGAGWEDGIL